MYSECKKKGKEPSLLGKAMLQVVKKEGKCLSDTSQVINTSSKVKLQCHKGHVWGNSGDDYQ